MRISKPRKLSIQISSTTKDIVNELLIWIQQDCGIKVSSRPRLDLKGAYLVQFNQHYTSGGMVAHKRDEIVGFKHKNLFDRLLRRQPIEPIFKQVVDFVPESYMVLRGWFIVDPNDTSKGSKGTIKLHLDRVPSDKLINYNQYHRSVVNEAAYNNLKNWQTKKAAFAKLQGGAKLVPPKPTTIYASPYCVIVNQEYIIGIEGEDSLSKFQQKVLPWVV